MPDSLGEVVAESHHLGVGQVALDRRDQVVALAEDRERTPRRYLSSGMSTLEDSDR